MYSRIVGMKRTTRHILIDRIGLSAIWFIFPLRLLAESITAGIYHNGGFLTGGLGDLLASFLPLHEIEYSAWWAYSISLGVFLTALPFTRYMHIPTEVMLVALRESGIKTRKEYTGYTEFEVHACSRCGICIDSCQIRHAVNRGNMVPAYYLQGVRQARDDMNGAFDCLMCGRCQEACPVNIGITAIRQVQRNKLIGLNGGNFAYLDGISISQCSNGSRLRSGISNSQSSIQDGIDPPAPPKTDVVYFAGCMTHLTPGIEKAMTGLLEKAKVNCWFMDRDGSVCCGRPLQLAGKDADALLLKEHNRKRILGSGASVLVTSCPICLRIFKEEYELELSVVHHTEYLAGLVKEGRLNPKHLSRTAVYHDPCELGRGLGEFDSSRTLLDKIVSLQIPQQERREALCCGGSIADLAIRPAERAQIAAEAVGELCAGNPDRLITSCPLCKKTFGAVSPVKVNDIAELLAEAC
jgi:Fe-S oxidoreductase